MTTQISITKTDNGNGQVEVVQVNAGAQTVLGTLETNNPMVVTAHSGQSFTLREKAPEDENTNRNGGLEGGSAGSVSIPGDNMSSGRTIR